MTNIKFMQSVSFYTTQLKKKKELYAESLKKDDIFEVRKKITEIRELEKLLQLAHRPGNS